MDPYMVLIEVHPENSKHITKNFDHLVQIEI